MKKSEIEEEFALASRQTSVIRALDGLTWFASETCDEDVREWIIRKQGDAIRALLSVAEKMHTEPMPGSSWQLHSWMLGEVERAIFGTDGQP